MVKCWDLEYNKVIRHYHGHLSGVYSLALHPTLDVLITGGRDSVARVWDMRTKVRQHITPICALLYFVWLSTSICHTALLLSTAPSARTRRPHEHGSFVDNVGGRSSGDFS